MLPYVLFPTSEVHHLMFSNAFDTMEGLKKKSSQSQIYGKVVSIANLWEGALQLSGSSVISVMGILKRLLIFSWIWGVENPKYYAAPAGDPGIGLEQLELMCKLYGDEQASAIKVKNFQHRRQFISQ
ncbi:hypothetical protein IGI04_023638 [Brassica rapa subsp. trilocularis]|uniref:Uncharacterized protein n=1 Tax=Brassica rapa subsp. trilocularis TaxID=1813537 RepID=A0ABQ7M4G0_BRACM|nr:hypothetical protein IGI04_023638 [Brassica rapa subsp. trilocularis]